MRVPRCARRGSGSTRLGRVTNAPHQASGFDAALDALRRGGVVAYPTEGVFGLGCDPRDAAALARLLELKGRPASAGLILIAAEFSQLAPWLAPLAPELEGRAAASWPGPMTWVWPAAAGVSATLTGGRNTLAVRVTAHPPAAALCHAFGGALVSTSANRHGAPPARTAAEVRATFGDSIDATLDADCGGLPGPTEIRDALTGAVLRRG
jgi:L-threonylcarbamoyladenylate synthase